MNEKVSNLLRVLWWCGYRPPRHLPPFSRVGSTFECLVANHCKKKSKTLCH